MLPGVSSKKRREPANGWSDLRQISRTRMKLWRDLNFARVFTWSIGIPSSVWGFLISDFWDLSGVNLNCLMGLGGVLNWWQMIDDDCWNWREIRPDVVMVVDAAIVDVVVCVFFITSYSFHGRFGLIVEV